MLDWLVGGDEERAVLLHNYMAALHYEVYVLLGMAVPEGETAYVLYRDKTSQLLRMINPSTGIATNVTDPTSPMQQVWVLVNQNDVISIKDVLPFFNLIKLHSLPRLSSGSTFIRKFTRVNCSIK